ncbi:MAG TPA: hypothetical protein VFX96_00410 [Pyrinomonadaceae bacterium]|nr:hypothetical protein [Pyrinomonadaceae bacterium]
MITFAQILEFVRSVCFGALAVSSLLMLAYSYFPGYFPPAITHTEVFFTGVVIGTLLHRALHAALFNPFSRALGTSFGFYTKLAELALLRRSGVISREEFRSIANQMKANYFGVPAERLSEAVGRERGVELVEVEELLRASEDAKRTLRELSNVETHLVRTAGDVERRLARNLTDSAIAGLRAVADAERAPDNNDEFDLDDTDDGSNNLRKKPT